MLKEKIINNIINLRPYSWVDLILFGYLAKFSVFNYLIFSLNDIGFIVGILSLWFFFNSALEYKHNYSYRGKTFIFLPVVFLIIAVIIAVFFNPLSLIPLTFSVFLIFIYLQKNKNRLLGIFSNIIRGLIASSFFFFIIAILKLQVNKTLLLISFLLFLLYSARALVGDIRDIKHNKEANKQTIPVIFGVDISKGLILFGLIVVSLICFIFLSSIYIILPLILFAITLIFFPNGYILH